MTGAIRDRAPYERAGAVLDQDFLDECYANLANRLVMGIEIQLENGTIYVSDRNHYIDNKYYVNRIELPRLSRSLGEFLRGQLDNAGLTVDVGNPVGDDDEFGLNKYFEGGSLYADPIGKPVIARIGFGEDISNYINGWIGTIKPRGGIKKTVKSIIIEGRTIQEDFDIDILSDKFSDTEYPNVDLELLNKYLPVVYGDWTVDVGTPTGPTTTQGASVPAFIINKNITSGNYTAVISGHALKSIGNVYLLRQEQWTDITASVTKDAANGKLTIAYASYQYQDFDQIFIKCEGRDTNGDGTGTLLSNPVDIAEDILDNYGGASASIDSTAFTTAKTKTSGVLARAYIDGESDIRTAVSYAADVLRQVRCELFVNRSEKFTLNFLYFDEFDADGFEIQDVDIEINTLEPRRVDEHFFNQARGQFNFDPLTNSLRNSTATWKNQASITATRQTKTRFIKYPNLYKTSDVEAKIQNTLRITSASFETISVNLTWRTLLLDIGDWVKINFRNASLNFVNTPVQVRDLSIDPNGYRITYELMSFQMIPFTSAANPWNPGYAGIVAGESAVITES